jgi:hypothetical protein
MSSAACSASSRGFSVLVWLERLRCSNANHCIADAHYVWAAT